MVGLLSPHTVAAVTGAAVHVVSRWSERVVLCIHVGAGVEVV